MELKPDGFKQKAIVLHTEMLGELVYSRTEELLRDSTSGLVLQMEKDSLLKSPAGWGDISEAREKLPRNSVYNAQYSVVSVLFKFGAFEKTFLV